MTTTTEIELQRHVCPECTTNLYVVKSEDRFVICHPGDTIGDIHNRL